MCSMPFDCSRLSLMQFCNPQKKYFGFTYSLTLSMQDDHAGYVSSCVYWACCIWSNRLGMTLSPVFGCLVSRTSNISYCVSYFFLQLDGYVARRMGINSVVGSYLDPLADKVSAFNQVFHSFMAICVLGAYRNMVVRFVYNHMETC